MSRITEFFERYEEGANTFEAELMSSLYTDEFMACDPNGVSCGKNDDTLKASFVARKAFFEQLGFREARVLGIDETPLDARYTMAKVHWHMRFEKDSGHPLDFQFYITYFLFDSDSGIKAAFWISHEDEQKVMRAAGLLPAEAS